jgi:glycerol-3-phosphate acyltransferase PlsX
VGKKTTISLDVMGGDHGPSVVVPAALSFLERDSDTELILVGREEKIAEHLGNRPIPDRLHIVHATETVGMDELPSKALRNKKDSSMRVAINLVKEGRADACVSAGNTGALMATARFVLKTLPHVDRPAIITALPAVNGRTWVLDLGANVDCSAEHLYQFAVMGSELVSAVENIQAPTVGLLNIGQEEIKGNEQVKGAHELLAGSATLNYLGYVEGDDIFLKDNLDIVVTDGFVGNVSLKTSEGVAKMIRHFIQMQIRNSLTAKLLAIFAYPILRGLKRQIDPRNYNGASLLGLKGIVVKSHGGADIQAFRNAISIAKKEVNTDIADRIAQRVELQLGNRLDDRVSA